MIHIITSRLSKMIYYPAISTHLAFLHSLSDQWKASYKTTTIANAEQQKEQIQAELQQGLMGKIWKEIMEQKRALSADLREEVKRVASNLDHPNCGPLYSCSTSPSGEATASLPQGTRLLGGCTRPAHLFGFWDSRACPASMSTQINHTPGFINSVAAEGRVVWAGTQNTESTSHPKPALVGECPKALIQINGCSIPFVLNTGSQVPFWPSRLLSAWRFSEWGMCWAIVR